jgi:hypothetical protein
MSLTGFSLTQQGINLARSTTRSNQSSASKNAPKILRYPVGKLDFDDYIEIKITRYIGTGFKIGQENVRLTTGTEVTRRQKILGYIQLPMPKEVPADTNQVEWGKDQLNSLEAYGIGKAQDALTGGELVGSVANILGNIGVTAESLAVSGNLQDLVTSFFAGKLVNSLGGNVTTGGIISRATGQILNPNLELLFRGVNLRSFPFTFELTPRDENEAKVIKQIIRTFKQAMAPKTSSSSDEPGAGLFVSAPEVFQIAYKSKGEDHPFLNSFKPCALTNMGVNYSGAGSYATYLDSTPVHMTLSLQFTELNPIYAEDYNEDLPGVGY